MTRQGRRLGVLTRALLRLPESDQPTAFAAVQEAIRTGASDVHDDDLLALTSFLDETDWLDLAGPVIDRKPAAQAM
jgi:hypothetical protein